jgi:hypothetical protein
VALPGLLHIGIRGWSYGWSLRYIGIRAKVFNTEPGWAMLVEIEAKFLERIVVEVDKIQSQGQGSSTEPGWAG